jgi:hypothetical protein
MSEKTATVIGKMHKFRGHAVLYKVNPPLPDYDGRTHEFVIVSSVVANFVRPGEETALFPAESEDSTGPSSWNEMPGSQTGTMSHEDTLGDLGYTIVEITH